MKYNIKYKSLLPTDELQVDVNTRMLPNKGNLVYEYNPFRNYRLNETKYQYRNKFYSEQELMNQLNVIPNVIYIDENTTQTKIVIARYYDEYHISLQGDIQLKYLCTVFNINNIYVALPPFDNSIENFYVSEDSILNNGQQTQIKVTYSSGVNYLKTVNGQYVIGYNSSSNEFVYGSEKEFKDSGIIGVDQEIYVSKGMFENISFHYKSDKFYQLTYNSVYQIKDEITKFHPGSLVDFSTNELNFSLSHPVQIIPQYAYDGSVNLILSDGYSKPKLINSRFSATGKNTYEIVDRKGNNDTNIYNQGDAFEVDTSLYKQTAYISKLYLKTVYQGGQLSVGNYHFYLTYADADGNETDFVAESGMVSLFLGNDVYSSRQGFRNENSFKGIKLGLTNIDPGYSYINVYFTRCTGDIFQNADTLAFKLAKPIFINNTEEQEINITGYEEIVPISLADINPAYHVVESAETIAASNNMLFLGNVKEATPNYASLADLALYFTPVLDTSLVYNNQNSDYSESGNDTYYDPNYIYNNVGYWPEEIYRFGIVFIQHDNTLTPVFNVRGINNLQEEYDKNGKFVKQFTETDIYDENGNRAFIDINENTNLLIQGNIGQLENNKGVVRLHSTADLDYNPVYGIKFKLCCKNREHVLNELRKVCKGYFFVRQRRIPTVLCEAITIGTDKLSHHPTLPTTGKTIKDLVNKKTHRKNTTIQLPGGEKETVTDPDEVLEFCPYAKYRDNQVGYVLESFMNMHREIVNTFEERIRVIGTKLVSVNAMICPDYDINYPYYNSIFNGASFTLLKSNWQPKNDYFNFDVFKRHFHCEEYEHLATNLSNENLTVSDVKILGVEDSTPLVGIGEDLYSGVAGIGNMGYKFDYIGNENKKTDADNLIRGVWGPFLAIQSNVKLKPCTVYTIMVPGYDTSEMEDYFKIRYADKNAYYTISDRFDLNNIEYNEDAIIYRGDCYICQFTHRVNRNFNDDTAPYNDDIVNKGTWRGENNGQDEDGKPNPGFEIEDGTIKIQNFDNINLGDINAVTLGHWVTFQLRSSFNLNIRAIDESDVQEVIKLGHGKGFYPYYPMSPKGSYKTKEALCINKGYEKSVGERYTFTHPDIPAQKNNFCNRILHSQPASNDAFKNGYRVFQKASFQDYQMTYGSITKILEYKESLLIVFEHGLALVGINDRALLTNAQGPNVYLQTNKVLPKELTIISDCYGSQWKDSIIKTPYAVYGVDTSAKKIWKFAGSGIELISDRTVQQFLNKNISLTERELDPIIGIRNVKTHYNKFKNDVMFTFYDDLDDIQEKVWNICYNENMQQFVTFYSWVPSYSDNINTSYFSFDRQTSKWITKLGISNSDSDFAQGITLYDGSSILPDKQIHRIGSDCKFGKLTLTGVKHSSIEGFKVVRDNLQNFKLFNVVEEDGDFYLTLSRNTKASDLLAELYYRCYETSDGEVTLEYKPNSVKDTETSYTKNTLTRAIYNSIYYPIKHDSTGRRVELPNPINKNKLAYILNLECNYRTLSGALKTFSSSITVTLQYNLQFLSTDFWRHGQAGIIDVSEKLKPTHWYGKQHPFEFEFVVSQNQANQKIFDNLIILSNQAEPESFHYEIAGDCYEFSDDKPNMYYRQEATEAFYQYYGQDIEYDTNFIEVKDQLKHKSLYTVSKESDEEHDYKEYFKDLNIVDENGNKIFVKSNLLALYYSRINSYNEIEDYYRQQITANKNYDTLSGAEIVWDDITNSYKIWSHAKAVNVDGPGGRLRGNMQYNEDRWVIQINPMNLRQKNETAWNQDVPPIVLKNSPVPDDEIVLKDDNIMWRNYKLDESTLFPEVLKDQGYVDRNNLDFTNWDYSKQIKLRDKYIRIRIRYSGKELAIIQAVQTLFRLSYS